MREQLNQYHGKKIVSRYDDSKGESVHTVYEIQGSGLETWQKHVQMGNHHAVGKILRMDCWNEIGQANSLSKALAIAKNPPAKTEEKGDDQ